MAVSASFHRNVILLTQVIQPNDDFKKHFREGMFDKPNTAGFLHISHYLLTIYNSERFKKLVVWPVVCKKTEAQYRNNVKDYLTIVATENPDINFPNILASHLFHAGGSKFTIIMWKLSQVVVRTYITREASFHVMSAPQTGPAGNLGKTFLQNANARVQADIQGHHRSVLATEETVKTILEEEIAAQAKTRTEIFEMEQLIANLGSSASVHPSIQKRLVDTSDTEVITMWKTHINKYMVYLQKQNSVLKELEQLSSEVKNVVVNNINGAKMLDGKQLKKIDSSTISELFSPNDQCLLFHLYKNNNLVLNNFIVLFHSLLHQLLQRLKSYPLQDLSKCLSQVEASCKDMKFILNCLQTFSADIAKKSTELEELLCTEKIIQAYSDNGLFMTNNVLLIPSPLIKINTNYDDEKNELQKRLQFTPVEAAHKSLFSRYERQNLNALRGSRVKGNFLISRINFEDTMSTTNDDNEALPTNLSTPKKIISSTRHPGKYSRLFSTRSKRLFNTTVNSSIMSIPCTAKANSTAITNAIEEMHDASMDGIDMTAKNISTSEVFVTPKKSSFKEDNKFEVTPPPKLPLKEDIRPEDTSEIDDIVNALPSKSSIPETGETTDKDSNYDKGIVKIEQPISKRRSIGDLVERYKRLLDHSSRKTSPANCSGQEI